MPSLSIADVSISEGNTGTKTVTLTVTLSAAYSSPVTVAYATGGGTATAGTDYMAKSGTLDLRGGRADDDVHGHDHRRHGEGGERDDPRHALEPGERDDLARGRDDHDHERREADGLAVCSGRL